MSIVSVRDSELVRWSVSVRLNRLLLPVTLSLFGVSASLLTGCGGSGSGSGGGGGQTGNPVPAIASVTPTSVAAGSPAQTLTVSGSSFVSGAVVSFNGTALPTTYTSSTSLQATIPASALSAGEAASVTVTNPSPGGGTSSSANFSIMSPTPKVTGISPTSLPQAQSATLTITGTGFESNSTVQWNGTALTTAFVSSTTLTVSLTAAQVQSLGSAQITVNNPGPGGSATDPVAVLVYPVPAITSISPASVAQGSPTLQITITGTNFVTGSVVFFDQTAIPTTYISSTSLTAQVPAYLLASGHNASVAVQNQTPIVTMSSPATFAVTAPTPVLTSISPNTVGAGYKGGTIALTGTGFELNSVGQWNGSSRTTYYDNSTLLYMVVTTADLANAGTAQVTVNNPAPGGGTSAPQTMTIVPPPVITSVSPATIQVPSSSSATATITVTGTNFASNATLIVGGQNATIVSETSTQIVATLSYYQLYTTGPVQVYVNNPVSANVYVESQPATVNVINPAAPFTITPSGAAVGSADLTITVNGSGYFQDSVVQWNGVSLTTTYVSSNSLTAVVPASMLALPGTATVDILSPENQGATPSTQGFSTFVVLPINDVVWNSHDGLIYATVSGRAGPGVGNSLVGIDPNTGAIQRTIFVGSEPNRLAISDDGTQAFVGLDNAGAVRQVNLQAGTAGVQWSLGGTNGIYVPPFTAESLAAVPGEPNSVAVYSSNGVVTIYDSGVARANASTGLATYFDSNSGGLAFGSSASTLYLSASAPGSYVYVLSVDSTGVTGWTKLTTSGAGTTLQYDNGNLYFPNAIVANATTGATLGQFSMTSSYSSTPVAADGPVVSDSTLNRAWVAPSNYSSTGQVIGYDETTFNPVTSVPLTGLNIVDTATSVIGGSPEDLIRWGQNGLALHTTDELYILHGAVVKDTSSSPADLQVTAQVPSAVTTGTAFTYQLTVTNLGPNAATGAVLTTRLPDALIYGSASASQGSCTGNGSLYCDLGAINNGASATVTITATPSAAGTVEINASVDSQSFDPTASNNNVSATTTSSGSLYSPVPSVTSISPNMIQSGSTTFTLTVNGTGFTTASTIEWNGTALSTTMVSSTQLTATVDSSLIQQLGWAEVSVSSAAPGGGNSAAKTLSIYSVLSVPANAMTWDPYTRKLYAVLPSTSTSITGNSVVSIDPATGTIGTPIQVGSEPNLITDSAFGNYLYIGLSGAESLARFNMASQTVDATVPLVTTGYFGGPAAATGLASIPGLDTSVAVDNIGIFDFTGTTATMRPNSAFGFNDAVFPDAGHAYTYDNESTDAELYRYTVDSSGVHLIDASTMLGMGGFSGGLALDNGIVYGTAGGIIDPTTTPPTQLGVLPLGDGPYGGLSGGGVVPYAAEQKSFNIGVNSAGTWMLFLERFDTVHFTMEDSIEFPTNNAIDEGLVGMRWGQDGLAYILGPGLAGNTTPQIFVMRGPFVLPAEATSNTAPTLTAVGSGTIATGTGNQQVAVTGSGFMPGASVVWNGVVHDTTFVNSQELYFALGATEISSAASVTVTVRNPGSTDSNAVTVTVH